MPALKASVVLPAEPPAATGAIHVPLGASSPTLRFAPACIATQTCTPPWLAPPVTMGTRIEEPALTCPFWCMGVSTMDPLLPAAATIARPRLTRPQQLPGGCRQAVF